MVSKCGACLVTRTCPLSTSYPCFVRQDYGQDGSRVGGSIYAVAVIRWFAREEKKKIVLALVAGKVR